MSNLTLGRVVHILINQISFQGCRQEAALKRRWAATEIAAGRRSRAVPAEARSHGMAAFEGDEIEVTGSRLVVVGWILLRWLLDEALIFRTR